MATPIITPDMRKQFADYGSAPVIPANPFGPAGMTGMAAMPSLPTPAAPEVSAIPHQPTQPEQNVAELGRLEATGSGVSQIQNPWLRGLARVGDIAESVIAPRIAAYTPGTTLSHQRDVANQEGLVAEDVKNQAAADTSAATGAETGVRKQQLAGMPQAQADTSAESEATTANLKSETKARDNPQPNLATAYAHAVNQAITEGRDPAKDPIVASLSDAITGLQKEPAPKGSEHINVVGPNGKPMVASYDPTTKKTYDSTGKELINPQPYEKPQVTNINAGEAALDRETKQFGAPHQKSLDAANGQLEKIADARSMISGNAESQALGIPKVLTALVGGQGTGVRITQPELQAIAKARGISGDIEGTLNSWAGKGKLTSTQQQQLIQIMDDVKARLIQKQAISAQTLDAINGASTREQIIAADKAARKQLTDLETGGGQSAAPSGADNEVYVSGKLVGHTVGGKYVPLAK